MTQSRADLADYVRRLRDADDDLGAEIRRALGAVSKPAWLDDARAALESVRWDAAPVPTDALIPGYGELEAETIVLRMGRPVVGIAGGAATLDFVDAGSETWRARLESSSDLLAPCIASIGRVEVVNHQSGLDYMGTGWLIDDGVVATNRHVALSFAGRTNEGYRFLTGFDRKYPVGVSLDFLEEFGRPAQDPVGIVDVLYIAKDNEPDVAFLLLDPRAPVRPAVPIPLALSLVPDNAMVAVIGYPARDVRIPDRALMDRIYGNVYGRKRLAPGFTTGFDRGSVKHDCTTLGGNSGSPVVDLATGEVCGLHYSGAFLRGNYAVPSPVLKRMLADARGPGGPLVTVRTGGTPMPETDGTTPGELRVTIPIEVTIKVGDVREVSALLGVAVASPGEPAGGPTGPADRSRLEAALAESRRLYGQRQDVHSIEIGWEFTDGWITDRRVVVIAVKHKMAPEDLASQGVVSFPNELLGVPIDVRVASLEEVNPEVDLEARGTGWTSTYERLPNEGGLLDEVDDDMSVILHASPDAGWPVLNEFLAGTKKRLTIGMYDFTAPHILDAVRAATKPSPRKLSLVLQRGESLGEGTKKDDISEEISIPDFAKKLKTRFEHSWAAIRGSASPFKTAYHIKVAVRDGKSFWLSSGNWQSSNQPNADPIDGDDTSPALISSNNRDWHVVVKHEGLARSFETYLLHDLAQATAFASEEAAPEPEPMVWVPVGTFQPSTPELEAPPRYTRPLTLTKRLRVQPLLTPDNYAEHVIDLIQSATSHLYFQNQSLSILETNPDYYEQLIDALLARQAAGLDVRMVIRRIGDIRQTVSRIRDYGFDTDQLRLQTNCHTKAIMVDGHAVLLGSHNWTGAGTGVNRDASLIFFDDDVTAYYEQLFLYDWERIGSPRIDESLPAPQLADPDDPTPLPGMVQVPLHEWLGET